MSFLRFSLASALTLTAACTSLESTARQQFVQQASCPADRVTVTHAPPQPAPPEIAADPARLAVWNENTQKRAKFYYVARGCGVERRHFCERQLTGEGHYQESLPDCTLVLDSAAGMMRAP